MPRRRPLLRIRGPPGLASRPMERRGNVLPLPATSFVGREQEREALSAALDRHRLVTLIGPAGVGKSRLAAEVARDRAALFIDLSRADEPRALSSEMFRALELEPVGAQAEVAAIADALDSLGARLVVLDDCDGVRRALAELLASLLARGGRSRFLCTARPVLGVEGEQRWPVEPLPSASVDGGPSAAEELFTARARLVRPDFAVAGREPELARILPRLGGFPLAIELCAAQLPVLGLRGLAEELHDPRGASPLQPLHDVVQASVRLLPPDAREALLRCAVFGAPFDREAARAVLRGDATTQLRTLVESSLLCSTGVEDPRFSMYEPVRAWAAAAAKDEPAILGEALVLHATHFLAGAEAPGEDPVVALERLLPEILLVERRLDAGEVQIGAVPDDAVRARLVVAAEPLLAFRGVAPDVDAWLARAVARAGRSEEVALAVRARLLSLAALVRQRQGNFATATALHLEAGEAALLANDPALLHELWLRWLVDRVVGGRYEEARVVGAALLDALGSAPAGRILHATRLYLATTALLLGEDSEGAIATLRREALSLRALGEVRLATIGQANLAINLLYLGRVDEAEVAAAALQDDPRLDTHTRTSIVANRAAVLHERAFTADLAGDPGFVARAHEAYRSAIAGFVRVTARGYAALVRAHHAMLWLELGDAGQAELEAVEALHDQPDRLRAAFSHAELASVQAVAGRIADAHALLDEARALGEGLPAAEACLELHASHVALRERQRAGTLTRELTQRAARAAKRHAATDRGPYSPRARIAARLVLRVSTALAKDSDRPPSPAPESWRGSLVVGRDDAWVRVPDGKQLDLSTRRKLRVLLSALVAARVDHPGEPLSRATLIGAVWPDERFVADAGRTRLHTLVLALRNLGLRELLRSNPQGYFLDPAVPLLRAEL